jgi:stage IV sporulation protein FB
MSWSLKVGTVAGTAVRIHFTFLLFLIWIGAAYYSQGGASAAYEGVLFVSLLFLCVLLHEFSHVFAARRYGVKTPTSRSGRSAASPISNVSREAGGRAVVAIAGPW